MIKRISCRVVSSTPLNGSNNVFQRAKWLNNKQHIINDATTVNIDFPPTYTSRSQTAKPPANNNITGQVLDCYA